MSDGLFGRKQNPDNPYFEGGFDSRNKVTFEGGFTPTFDEVYTNTEDGAKIGVKLTARGREHYYLAPGADDYVLAPREVVDDLYKSEGQSPVPGGAPSPPPLEKRVMDSLPSLGVRKPHVEGGPEMDLPAYRNPKSPMYDPDAPRYK